MPQVRIDLDDDLFAVLERYAEEECRLPTGQATWLIRLALRERLKFDAALRHLESRGPGPSLRGEPPTPREPMLSLPPATDAEPF